MRALTAAHLVYTLRMKAGSPKVMSELEIFTDPGVDTEIAAC